MTSKYPQYVIFLIASADLVLCDMSRKVYVLTLNTEYVELYNFGSKMTVSSHEVIIQTYNTDIVETIRAYNKAKSLYEKKNNSFNLHENFWCQRKARKKENHSNVWSVWSENIGIILDNPKALFVTDKNVSRHSKYYQKLYFVLLHNLQMDYKSTIKTTKHLFSFNISLGNSNVKSKNEIFVESWRLCYNFLYRRKSVHWWNSPTRQRGIICLYVLQYLQSFDCIYDIL